MSSLSVSFFDFMNSSVLIFNAIDSLPHFDIPAQSLMKDNGGRFSPADAPLDSMEPAVSAEPLGSTELLGAVDL